MYQARGEHRSQVHVPLAPPAANEVVAGVKRREKLVQRNGVPEQLTLARGRRLRLEDVEGQRIAQVVDDPRLRLAQPVGHKRVGRTHDHHVGVMEKALQRAGICRLVPHVPYRSQAGRLSAGRDERDIGRVAERACDLVRTDRRSAEHLPDAVLRHDQNAAWHCGSVPSGGR